VSTQAPNLAIATGSGTGRNVRRKDAKRGENGVFHLPLKPGGSFGNPTTAKGGVWRGKRAGEKKVKNPEISVLLSSLIRKI